MTRRLSAATAWWCLAILAPATGGCYRLSPIESTPDAGREVRVDLTDAGSTRLASLIGPRIESLDGRAVQATDSSLVLAVSATIARSGMSVHWSNERVDVPRTAIARVRGRQLDRKRTWLMAAVGVVGVIAIGEAFGLGSGLAGLISGRRGPGQGQ